MSNNSFSQLKSSRKSSLEKLTGELTKMQSGSQQSNGPDERFWTPTVDKMGNGVAVIRFLPAPKDEDVPFVRIFSHGFKGPTGSWYIENSRTTIGESDPVSDLNTKLWNSGIESDKDLARDQKRKLHFISNILVVKDPSNPENEGKVFLYKFGKKIFDKLNDLMNPAFDDEEPVNPFDFWEGANFRLKIRQVDGYRNYDKSDFDTSSSVSDDDSELENIWNLQYSLQEFVDPKNFKSYEELQNKLDRVLGNESVVVKPKKVVKELEEESPPEMKSVSTDSDDDLDELFKSLSEE
jgi:hypothetical protein